MTTPVSPASVLKRFISSESAGGLLLMAAAAVAIAIANSPLSEAYRHLLHAEWGPTLTPKLGPMTPHLWINDGLMAIFFLLVGLEIKRELTDGRLSTWKQRRLPALPALFGMAIPALIYAWMTKDTPGQLNGWAIPAATDIAFALGLLALLGKRAPLPLKILLMSIAIIDDMGAVAIIAIFYTSSLNMLALVGAAAVCVAMWCMSRAGVARLWPYVLALPVLWYLTLLSGVHATLAGVIGALLIPYDSLHGRDSSPLVRIEHAIALPVAILVMPIFGLANAGVDLRGLSVSDFLSSIPLGVAAGLFIGKQLAVFGGVVIAAKTGLAAKPEGVSWAQIYGVSLLCGIGFTMSLFISGLAFPGHEEWVDQAKLGIIAGSVASALLALAVLRISAPPVR
ncbi:TPA: Na+/H+ antiporter NhaA [Stenotrophomonas maltophilia]|uniref:Na+/H+ antiporter NhaA n=1 Tax=Stenotrophomonas TaxID=40323 RepID=UPI00122FB654|nr:MULTISPECIES: Na+/H+ antiporter NhaA [Stenotrophomonas]MBA0399904.1 Na+/H+ antiporter NhaA [Stenotrophomonas maltophilia]UUS15970.1 Na+/H+ antiporter NhaA [Stenotrophomonas sp. CD2]HEL3255361.1 Na+/H+ antiporter NhaA [Stenotrophomonas maltophilia]